jgi:transcriptional regulator with XRE-family HTH domain
MTDAKKRPKAGCGQLLRYWRGVRKMSQLDLALESGVSTRHISFVESGKSVPSRELLLTLADTLDVPLRERNALLHAAGYAHLYELRSIDAPELAGVLRSLRTIVERMGPYPAAALDGQWNLLFLNRAGERVFGPLMEGERNFARVFFKQATRDLIENWDEVAHHFVQRLHREALADPRSRALVNDLIAKGEIPREHQRPNLERDALPVIAMRVRAGDARLTLFTTITTLGTPLDVALSELRIESYLPADDESEALLRALCS